MKRFSEQVIDRLVKIGKGSRSRRWKVFFTILDLVFFGVIIPSILLVLSLKLDESFGLTSFFPKPSSYILAGVLFAFGCFWDGWSAFTQIKKGGGSTLPLYPTQKLLTRGPYAYSRNPLIFGSIILLIGVGMFFNSVFFTFVFLPLWVLLQVLYLKFIEEKELEEKFGQAYVDYKSKTPMLFPRLRKLLCSRRY